MASKGRWAVLFSKLHRVAYRCWRAFKRSKSELWPLSLRSGLIVSLNIPFMRLSTFLQQITKETFSKSPRTAYYKWTQTYFPSCYPSYCYISSLSRLVLPAMSGTAASKRTANLSAMMRSGCTICLINARIIITTMLCGTMNSYCKKRRFDGKLNIGIMY